MFANKSYVMLSKHKLTLIVNGIWWNNNSNNRNGYKYVNPWKLYRTDGCEYWTWPRWRHQCRIIECWTNVMTIQLVPPPTQSVQHTNQQLHRVSERWKAIVLPLHWPYAKAQTQHVFAVAQDHFMTITRLLASAFHCSVFHLTPKWCMQPICWLSVCS